MSRKFNIKDKYRTNPLSLKEGGRTVYVKYYDTKKDEYVEFAYKNIKNVKNYINALNTSDKGNLVYKGYRYE